MQQLRDFEHLLGPCTDPVVFRQVNPAHGAGPVQEKLSGPCDVIPVFTGASVNQVVTPYHFSVGIGKKSETVTFLLSKVARYFRSIDADRNWTNTNGLELVQTLFNAPQLGVTGGSPVASVKNE